MVFLLLAAPAGCGVLVFLAPLLPLLPCADASWLRQPSAPPPWRPAPAPTLRSAPLWRRPPALVLGRVNSSNLSCRCLPCLPGVITCGDTSSKESGLSCGLHRSRSRKTSPTHRRLTQPRPRAVSSTLGATADSHALPTPVSNCKQATARSQRTGRQQRETAHTRTRLPCLARLRTWAILLRHSPPPRRA